MLFSGDEGRDKIKLLEALQGFGAENGLDRIQIHEPRLIAAISEMYDVPWCGQTVATPAHASLFKKVGAFVTSFCKHSPIATELPETSYGEFSSYQNAIFAYSCSVEMLHGAEFWCQTRNGWIILKEKIDISTHALKELIVALSKSDPSTHFVWASLVFEALVYQKNPEAAYPKKKRSLPSVELIGQN